MTATTAGRAPALLARRVRAVVKDYGFIVAALVAMAGFSLLEPAFLKRDNLIGILSAVSIIGVMAVCSTFVVISGGIDLSVGPVLGLAGLLAAFQVRDGRGVAVALLAATVVGVVIGTINGALVSRLHLPPLVVTLAMMSIIRGVALRTGDAAPHSITGPKSFLDIGRAQPFGVSFPVYIFAAVALIAYFVQRRTRFGYSVFAIGENEEAARLSGLPILRIKTLVYVVSGFGAALGGVIYAAKVSQAQSTFGTGMELDVIAAIVVGGSSLFGGTGSVHRSVLGALTIGMINSGLSIQGIDVSKQLVIKGAIIVAAIAFDQFLRRER